MWNEVGETLLADLKRHPLAKFLQSKLPKSITLKLRAVKDAHGRP